MRHALGGFPWATLGYALHADLPLLAHTRWGGVYVLSFAAAAAGIALGRHVVHRDEGSRRVLVVVAGALVVLHAAGALWPVAHAGPTVPVRVAAIQGNIDQGEKWDAARRERILAALEYAHGKTDRDGIAVIRHFQVYRRQQQKWWPKQHVDRFEAVLLMPLQQAETRPFAGRPVPEETIELRLPPTGSIALRTVDLEGRPFTHPVHADLRMQTGQAVEIIAMTMAVYLTLSLLISAFMNWYNKKMALVER